MGEIWKAKANEPINSGDEVIVKEMQGLTLKVRKANDVVD
jgi:membrane protein implicated in regulation of membrane protease activity